MYFTSLPCSFVPVVFVWRAGHPAQVKKAGSWSWLARHGNNIGIPEALATPKKG
jgi:hypothetical protein